MSNEMLAYSVRSLVHSFNGEIALDVPNLDISAGEACGLTGLNGCGKTTLLSILAILLRPVSGSVRLFGETAGNGNHHLRRKVTLVHQKPVLFSTTVRNNIEYGLRTAGLSSGEVKERTERILERMNLREIAGKQARKLSGGEAQRAVLARGLVLETPILLLDEPTNALDNASRPLFYDLLRRAKARGTTIIVATHDSGILTELHPRILRMDSGRILD